MKGRHCWGLPQEPGEDTVVKREVLPSGAASLLAGGLNPN